MEMSLSIVSEEHTKPPSFNDCPLPRQFLNLPCQRLRLSLQSSQFRFQALKVPAHRLIEELRRPVREPVQFVVRTLPQFIHRLQHTDDFQIDALPQAAQLIDLVLLPEVERRPALPQDEAVRVVRGSTGHTSNSSNSHAGRARQAGRTNQTFEPIDPLWQAIRAWIPADDDESETDTPELWDQTTATGWKAPAIDLGDGRTLVLEYT